MRGRGRAGRGRGRGGRRVVQKAPVRPSKQYTDPKSWTESDQQQVLSQLLQILRSTSNSNSNTSKKDYVEFYSVSDLVPYVISRIGTLPIKPTTRDQLHSAIKKSLLGNPASTNAPRVDVIFLFSKLLADGLISISIKQEVCFYNPPLPQYTNPRSIQVVDRPKDAPYEVNQDLTWSVNQAWNEKQKLWKNIQNSYFTKNEDKIEKTDKYQCLQHHYLRVRKWIENITQKQIDAYKQSYEENNNNTSTDVVGIEFHTHSTPWTFLTTLSQLFRVSRKIDDKLVDEVITSLVENGRLKIENDQLTYLNKLAGNAASVPPIAPAITSIFAPTPSDFYQYNRISVQDEDGDIYQLLPILAKIGNPETTFYIFTKEEEPKKPEASSTSKNESSTTTEQSKALEQKAVQPQTQAKQAQNQNPQSQAQKQTPSKQSATPSNKM